MNNQNFYLRLIALLLIIMAVFFYNGTVKDKEQTQNITDLTEQVAALEDQQEEILTALQENYEAQQKAAQEKAAQASENTDTAQTEEETKEETNTEESSADTYYKDGTFEGSGTGYGGQITVQITLKSDEITDVSIVSAPGEDSAYLSQAQNIISTILSEQSTDVDTISGATFSSNGILEAVNNALTKAENQ